MIGLPLLRTYKFADGDKTLILFTRSRARAQCLMGPVGAGKTLCVLMKFLRLACEQAAHPQDGIRRTRFVVMRDTYRNLERTVIKTWRRWVPPDAGKWTGGANGEPAVHALSWDLTDGTRVETEIMFIAVGEQDAENVMRGFEMTGVYINEADTLPEDLFINALGRAGRYPDVENAAGFKGATWSGVLIDCNAPNHDNWVDRRFIKARQEGFEFFSQPGGLDDKAENLRNLPGGRRYYENLAAENPEWWVRRMIHNELGFSRDGKPVYGESFSRRAHVAQYPLKPIRERKIVVGLDGGRHPAAVAMQETIEGRLLVLAELCLHWIGAAEFGRILASWIGEKFPWWDIAFVADPATFKPTELSEHAEDVWAEIVGAALDQPILEAPSNRRAAREAGMLRYMRMPQLGDKAMFLVSPECPTLIEGLEHKFRFKQIGNSSNKRFSQEVDKNEWSHVCEAAEYAALHIVGYANMIGPKVPRIASPDDDRDWQLRFGT
jgi:hypothetical protein